MPWLHDPSQIRGRGAGQQDGSLTSKVKASPDWWEHGPGERPGGRGEPPKLQGRARLILLVLPASGATARMRSSSSAKRLPGSISPVAPPPAGTRLVDWENPVWCARSAFPVALQVVPPTESSQTLTNARARCRGNNVGHDCAREASAG